MSTDMHRLRVRVISAAAHWYTMRTVEEKRAFVDGLNATFDALNMPQERLEAEYAAESVLFPDAQDQNDSH